MSTGLKSHESGTEGEDKSRPDFDDIFGYDEDEGSMTMDPNRDQSQPTRAAKRNESLSLPKFTSDRDGEFS